MTEVDQSVRTVERDVMSASSFNATKYLRNRASAHEALGTLSADDPALPELRRRLMEAVAKADQYAVDSARVSIQGQQRMAEREWDNLQQARTQRGLGDVYPANAAERQKETAQRMRTMLEEARVGLDSEPGRAFVAEVEGWLVQIEARVAEARVLDLAREALQAEVEVAGGREMRFIRALEAAERKLADDPEAVIAAWDAAKKLLARVSDPAIAGVTEIAAALERFRALEPRIAGELAPRLAAVRVKPLIDGARHSLELLVRDTDNLDEENVLRWRKDLRAKLVPLQDAWADQPDAKAFLAKCARAMRRAEEDLGDKMVLRELVEVEAVVIPLVERLERALARKATGPVCDHAPRLRARLPLLTPHVERQRAQLLHDRATAALARAETELGSEVAKQIAEAEAVPRFPVDLAADSRVQAAVEVLQKELDRYREQLVQMRQQFEEDVDLVTGQYGHGIASGIDSAKRSLIRSARRAEELTEELAQLDAAHPAVIEMERAAPALVKRAQAMADLLTRKLAYADAIARAHYAFSRAEDHRRSGQNAGENGARYDWPEVVSMADQATAAATEAAGTLADDHDEADAIAAKAAAIRTEALETITSTCLAEVARLAQLGHSEHEAREYIEVLRKVRPDAPEIARAEAILGGAADARTNAESEIRAKDALIRARATEAGEAALPAYEAWAEAQAPIVALAGTIVADPEKYRGKHLAFTYECLGLFLSDEPYELGGDMFWLEFDADIRAKVRGGLEKLDAIYHEMAEEVLVRHAISGLGTTTQHYPRKARFVCEIVGTAQYTPSRDVRDPYGRVLCTIDGTPYAVPRVVVRGLATRYCVAIPGAPASVDAMARDGIVGPPAA